MDEVYLGITLWRWTVIGIIVGIIVWVRGVLKWRWHKWWTQVSMKGNNQQSSVVNRTWDISLDKWSKYVEGDDYSTTHVTKTPSHNKLSKEQKEVMDIIKEEWPLMFWDLVDKHGMSGLKVKAMIPSLEKRWLIKRMQMVDDADLSYITPLARTWEDFE